ncbi:sensor histidine kinase [Hydrogenophaga sp.]|uniref:sensor histidine kinase n=1 Tax=Hydrogenophaga sp. TaxID=1904254 RepID=UPI003567A59D
MNAASGSARPTLGRHLLFWALGVLALVWAALVVVAFSTARRETNKFTDGQLVAVSRLWMSTAPQQAVLPKPVPVAPAQEYVQDMSVLVWDGDRLATDTHHLASGVDLSLLQRPGFSVLLDRGVNRGVDQGAELPRRWRAYVAPPGPSGGQRRVAVLMDMAHRDALGADMAAHIALPALLVMPLVGLLLWWAIRRGLRPLDALSQEIAQLDGMAGQRLEPQHRFREFGSTVSAINQLVDGLQAQALREREFASDVAHELRTPLASVALQANAARHALTAHPAQTPADMPDFAHALEGMEQESLRAGHILSQLLDLARAQRPAHVGAGVAMARSADLGEIAAQVLAAHAQEAHDSGHELSLEQPDERIHIPGAPMLLELALRNLVSNALRHTPAGTQVWVEVWRDGDAVGVSVSDDGQRAGAASGAQTADDGLGLGLGLRLVQRIAQSSGADLQRVRPRPPMTTCFRLRWKQALASTKIP